jgi:hypothetical protein
MNSGSLEHLGKIAVVEADALPAYIGGFLGLFRCPGAADRKVLEYNLLSARFRRLVASAKDQNISNLTEAKLSAFELHVPRSPEAFMAQARRREAQPASEKSLPTALLNTSSSVGLR